VEQSVDIRPYVSALQQRWWLLLGGALVAGALALGVSFVLPPTYEAQAFVLVADDRQIIQFDPRIETVEVSRPLAAYPVLATGDPILSALLVALGPGSETPQSVAELRDILSVSTTNAPSLLTLAVRHRRADTAAAVANRWAELFVEQANAVLGDQSGEQADFYRRQQAAAEIALADQEQALATSQATNRQRLLSSELEALTTQLNASLAQRQHTDALLRDLAALRDSLALQPGQPLAGDQLAVLLLYLRAFGADQPIPAVQLQLDQMLASPAGRDELIAALDSLQSTLESIAAKRDQQIEAFQPQILDLQGALQVATAEETRLRREVDLAAEAYAALSRQVTEESIASQDEARGLRLAGRAVVPDQPIAPRPWLNGALAFVVALAGLSAVTLFGQWHRM